MRLVKTVLTLAVVWIGAISLLHAHYNLGIFKKRAPGEQKESFRVGFLPVTCHLTCPVTDFIHKSLEGRNHFEPVRFSGWPEIKEAFLSGYLPATFLLAPMAMALREQGVPIKIVYLGHRDGTAMIVQKESAIFQISDLRGKRVAVPNRYSNQRLLLFKALKEHGVKPEEVEILEMAPPDMPAALYAKAVDAISSGEPFMGQAEMDGYGRVLYLTKDVWPNFISCVLVVHEETIKTRRSEIQQLVDGIAKSGKWLDDSMTNRMDASEFVSKNYYNQDPRLLRFVLSKPPDRVKYTKLGPLKKDFEEIEELGKVAGILNGTAHFEDYVDDSFAPDEATLKPHAYPAPAAVKAP